MGVRVAVRVAGQRLVDAAAEGGTAGPAAVPAQPAVANFAQRRSAAAGGVRGLLQPFRRAGRIVGLQVAGVFFLLPAVVFAPVVWRTRESALAGPDHRTFIVAAIVVVLFAYLGGTSFWRARRKTN